MWKNFTSFLMNILFIFNHRFYNTFYQEHKIMYASSQNASLAIYYLFMNRANLYIFATSYRQHFLVRAKLFNFRLFSILTCINFSSKLFLLSKCYIYLSCTFLLSTKIHTFLSQNAKNRSYQINSYWRVCHFQFLNFSFLNGISCSLFQQADTYFGLPTEVNVLYCAWSKETDQWN